MIPTWDNGVPSIFVQTRSTYRNICDSWVYISETLQGKATIIGHRDHQRAAPVLPHYLAIQGLPSLEWKMRVLLHPQSAPKAHAPLSQCQYVRHISRGSIPAQRTGGGHNSEPLPFPDAVNASMTLTSRGKVLMSSSDKIVRTSSLVPSGGGSVVFNTIIPSTNSLAKTRSSRTFGLPADEPTLTS